MIAVIILTGFLTICKSQVEQCSIVNNEGCSNSSEVANFFNLPIHDLQSEQIQLIINQAIESLDNNHYFHIPQVLTQPAIDLFLSEITSQHNRISPSINIRKTFLQDKGDYDRYPSSNHSRNFLHWSSQIFIGKSALISSSSKIPDLYSYPPLLDFFKAILKNSKVSPYSNLYLSKDPEGSVYGFIFKDTWSGSWHVDEHPFSCVWSIQRALYASGSFAFAYTPPDDTLEDGWDYDLLSKIFHNDTAAWKEHVGYIHANEGDVYCFNGNVTMHAVNPIYGPVDRVVFVTTFGETEDFANSDSVNEFNQWSADNQAAPKQA